MQHDPERVAEAKAWFVKAARDLRTALHDLTAAPPLLDDVAFHCQQSVEKTLKGYLAWHDRIFRKTHNIEELGEQCLRVDATLRPLVDSAVPLTEYAWKFRYPGDPEEPTQAEAEHALVVARDLYDAVLARLPLEVRP